MNKIIILLIFSLFFINNAYGLTNIPNNINASEDIYYIDYNNGVIDNIYELNSSDSFNTIDIQYKNYNYPYDMYYAFIDNYNNTLLFEIKNSLKKGYIFDDAIREYNVYFNNVKIGKTNYLNDTLILGNLIAFGDKIELSGSGYFISGNLGIKKFSGNLDRIYYFNTLEINNINSYYEITAITIRYSDKGISYLQYSIDAQYDNLNFILKFLFLILKFILNVVWIASAGYVLSNYDVLTYQSMLIEPLSLISYGIDLVFSVLSFIWVMGILWFFAITVLILFIVSYIKEHGNLLDTFKTFIENAIKFYSYTVINPLLWIYEHLLIRIITLIKS